MSTSLSGNTRRKYGLALQLTKFSKTDHGVKPDLKLFVDNVAHGSIADFTSPWHGVDSGNVTLFQNRVGDFVSIFFPTNNSRQSASVLDALGVDRVIIPLNKGRAREPERRPISGPQAHPLCSAD